MIDPLGSEVVVLVQEHFGWIFEKFAEVEFKAIGRKKCPLHQTQKQ